ncbi:uncharacterized protein LOC106639834 [Copidosoma floridanum]|uniref:uncharacterized protein LOC106639834 n=1 Tax=Copidosoma floridanum TaxID=29053 RepID=UPI000C6F51D8|nr:uncharacterized protein LOC106639834 [Copidosoma floridanum]
MASNDVAAASQPEIVLRDLESLLRQSLGEQAQVVDYTTTLLLPKGENYASTILKVDAVVKRTKNSPEERLPLVAKMLPPTEFQRNMINATVAFKKEFFVFERLLNVYRQIEEEAGVRPEDQIDVLANFYGGRLTLNEGSEDADDDAAMLMENLNARGYYTMDRLKGLDLSCAKMVMAELARFHALGIAAKQKRPDFFAEARQLLDVFPFELKENEFDDVTDLMVKAICAHPPIAKYEDRIKAAVKKLNWDSFLTIRAEEPYVTFIHGDAWVNNFMFHKENGKVDGLKFVDFQITRATSPLLDLPYFLCCSTSVEVIDNHFDELIDIYYEKFIGVLKKVGCDVSPFSRDSFDEQLKKDGSDEFFHCLMAMKFFTLEATDDLDLNDMKGSVMLSAGSNLYLERSSRLVEKFVEKESSVCEMSTTDTTSANDRLSNIVLRDLESLLRQSLGEQVRVVKYKTASLLPPGENYGSSVLKVEAVIKSTKDAPEEELSLVAKMLPPTELQRLYIDLTASFGKEIFVFERLINAYRKIEEEAGVAYEDLIDILPKFYGGRLSLRDDNREADEDAVLLMENLVTSGYYTMDRMKGLDVDHAKLAITELARYHALGIALKIKKPKLFEEGKKYLEVFPFDTDNDFFDVALEYTTDMICSDERIAKYGDKVREKMKKKWASISQCEIANPIWLGISHGDLWVNNLMFRKADNGKLESVKFIDFQVSQVCSPLKDLPYFTCTSITMEVMDNHFEDLLDTYYAKFINVLETVGCDTSPFTRESFDEQLKNDAKNELFHCVMALKVFTNEKSDDLDLNKMDSQIFSAKGSGLYLDRVWNAVSKFAEKGWL